MLAETDLAAAIHDGQADAGVAIEAAARAQGLAFIPLAVERLDLVLRRRDYFEPPVQALLAFLRTPEFAAQATHGRLRHRASADRVQRLNPPARTPIEASAAVGMIASRLALGKNSCSPPIL